MFFHLAYSHPLLADRSFDHQEDDEIWDDAIEEKAEKTKVTSIPSVLRATIKFGYDDGMKEELGSEDFNDWIAGVFTHTQAHFRHASLGTRIEFEVYNI